MKQKQIKDTEEKERNHKIEEERLRLASEQLHQHEEKLALEQRLKNERLVEEQKLIEENIQYLNEEKMKEDAKKKAERLSQIADQKMSAEMKRLKQAEEEAKIRASNEFTKKWQKIKEKQNHLRVEKERQLLR